MRNTTWLRWLAVMLALGLIASACGSDDDGETADEPTAVADDTDDGDADADTDDADDGDDGGDDGSADGGDDADDGDTDDDGATATTAMTATRSPVRWLGCVLRRW